MKFLFIACVLVFAGCATPPPARNYVMHDRDRNDPAPKLPSEIDPAEETRAAERLAESAREESSRIATREAYLAANARPAEIARALRAGSVFAGMTVADVRIAYPAMALDTESGGLGGSRKVFINYDSAYVTHFFFQDGVLYSWSRTQRY